LVFSKRSFFGILLSDFKLRGRRLRKNELKPNLFGLEEWDWRIKKLKPGSLNENGALVFF